ncbi:MAG: helix-turn-helix transcriptional regulator [Candidatus Izemoplasma sp.]|nr:helix-turn-helix transcriptional regulator [Candidatus Izemoplasma sp.]
MNDLGERLKQIRNEKGFPQKTVADFLKLNRTNYSKIENNQQKMTTDQLALFCQFFDVSADYILNLRIKHKKVFRLDDINQILKNIKNIETIIK